MKLKNIIFIGFIIEILLFWTSGYYYNSLRIYSLVLIISGILVANTVGNKIKRLGVEEYKEGIE
jgi:hypothetical protein|tara:strand:+ start:1776 stop:1967 length:192 start_codon:yes stop_codon:yes gene_type:complete